MSGNARILVVEDEAVVALDIRTQLERLGYEVIGTTGRGEEAERLAREGRPDLVLMDIRLEGGDDGVEIGGRLRAEIGAPVVFLTAFSDEPTLRRAKAVAPHGYILKPFDVSDLSATVEMALSRRQAERGLERSHAELRALLDAQRHGTVLVDSEARLAFASLEARRLLGLPDEVEGRGLEVMALESPVLERIERTAELPPERRDKIEALGATGADGRTLALEIEVVDDPRETGGLVLFLYDVTEVRSLRRLLESRDGLGEMVGRSDAMRLVFGRIEELARVDSPVLITGETGTGKELVARAIHRLSGRARSPFVAVNCGGLSDELALSQLFGHRRGAFTGAVDHRPGMFEAAEGGTLFLDEIGELSERVQAMLLRVLEERAVTRVGETRARPVDIRLVSATSRELDGEGGEAFMRRDLLYRIRVGRVVLPPLRGRREDLPLLARTFLADARERLGKAAESFDTEAMRRLLAYTWPGNVRELKHAVEHAVIHAGGAEIRLEHLPPEVAEAREERDERSEPELISAALEEAGGNRKRAAELLGMSRSTLYRRLERLGIGTKDR